MEPLLTTVAGTALAEGVKFLYAQASEILKAWRARRQNASARPQVLPTPDAVQVGQVDPLLDPRDRAMEDTLLDLRDLAEQVTTGVLDPYSPQARKIVGDLRDYLEVILQTSITFAGEAARSFETGRIDVVSSRVEGDVAGVRARGGAAARLGDVSVRTGEVADGGRVTGVELG